jgi:PAS domain S-box-containing protein
LRSKVCLGYLAAGLVAAALYPMLSPTAGSLLFTGIAVTAFAATVAGIHIHRPRPRWAWYLVALGMLLWVGGAVSWSVYTVILHVPIPSPSAADIPYLLAYPVQAVGLLGLIRARSPERDRAGVIDSLIVAVGLGAVSWVFFMSPYLHVVGLSPVQRAVSMAYPFLDTVLVAVLVRLLFAVGRRGAAYWLLTVGTLVLVASDSVWATEVLSGRFVPAEALFSGWMVYMVGWGAAALHPSMRRLSEPVDQSVVVPGRWRLLFLGLGAVLAPSIILLEEVRGTSRHGAVLAALAVVLFGLVMLRVRSLMVDVAEHQRIENELAKLARIVEFSTDAIYGVDDQLVIATWNGGAERLFGYSAAEAVGLPVSALIPQERRRDLALFERLRAGGAVEELETLRRRKDGSEFPVSVTVSPILDPANRFVGVSVIARDVSDRQKAEAAERANLAKSEFLSRMSHELRTPLNAILGFAQLLEMDALDPEQREGTQQILKAGRHLLGLIDEVLDVSRVDSGRLSLSVEALDLSELVEETVDLIRPLAAQRDITVSVPTANDGSVVLADRQRLKQVLLNLLSNAVKYNQEGGRVVVAWSNVAADRLRVAVADTGPGIPLEVRGRLFSPFDRLGAEQTTVQGSGLGLALAKRLVEAMGGSIGLECEEGSGARFWIELPVRVPPAAPDGSSDAAEHVPEKARVP